MSCVLNFLSVSHRSSYFQQIEEDVQKYAKSIEELKTSIQKFQTKDMKELLEFHSKVESVLEKLTDETQVRCRSSCLLMMNLCI